MNNTLRENLTSLVLGILALAGLLLWLKYQPKPPADWADKSAGAPLCPGFTDSSEPAAVTIIRPKQETSGQPNEKSMLKLERGAHGWVIKTADDAPADSADRMTMVLAPLLRLTILSDIHEINAQGGGTAAEFHRTCGLLDPADASASDMKDAGIRLTVTGNDNETFADLIIGRVPEGSSAVRDIRYVRIPGEDAVFTADFSGETLDTAGEEKAIPYADRLSVNPADWMNRDLLRISRWNIVRMTLYDCAFDQNGAVTPKQVETVAQDPDRPLSRAWELLRLLTFPEGKPQETEISDENRFPESEPLNTKADEICHLHFTRLLRKPAGFAEILAAGRPAGEWTPFADQLKEYGFCFADHDPANPDSTDPALFGKEGTVILSMNDGIKLTLLFGADDAEKGQTMMVVPSLDEETFPAPELQPIPDNASEEEKARIADENRLRESETRLNRAEAETKLKTYKTRFSDWLYIL